MESVKFLNPSFRTDFIPDNGAFYTLVLPHTAIKKFFISYKDIYAYEPSGNSYALAVKNAGEITGKKKITYTVRSGDYYHRLALAFGCTVDDINAWNPDAPEELSVGQRLNIWTDSTSAKQYSSSSETTGRIKEN